MTVFDLHPDQSGIEKIMQQWKEWEPDQRHVLETLHRRKDGRVFPVEVSTGKVKSDKEEVILAAVHDITERKEAEEKLKEKKKEVELNNERLESLVRISQLKTGSTQEMLDFALNEAVVLTNSKIGYIFYYNEEKKQFILNTWSKDVMKECTVEAPYSVYDLDETGCWGEAVRQRKPIVINDYEAEHPFKKGLPEGHVKLERFLTIPVIIDGKIVATPGVANKKELYDSSDVLPHARSI